MASPMVGLIGCGGWGSLILRDLLALGCRVTVVGRSEASRQRARDGGASVVVSSVSLMGPVDGIVVATPTSTHADVLDAVIDWGVPVFVEKPLCDDATRAADLARRAAGRLFVMDKWRYHAGVQMLAAIARAGELGRVRGVRTMRIGWGTSHPDVDCVWTLLPHDLSIVLEILGVIPSARSGWHSRVKGRVTEFLAHLGVDPFVICEISDRSPVNRREIQVLGEDATAVLQDGYSQEILIFRTVGNEGGTARIESKRPFEGEMPLLAELRMFVEHLAGGPPPKSSSDVGVDVVRRIAELRELSGLERSDCHAASHRAYPHVQSRSDASLRCA